MATIQTPKTNYCSCIRYDNLCVRCELCDHIFDCVKEKVTTNTKGHEDTTSLKNKLGLFEDLEIEQSARALYLRIESAGSIAQIKSAAAQSWIISPKNLNVTVDWNLLTLSVSRKVNVVN